VNITGEPPQLHNMVYCIVRLKGYHIHIRSTSHNQKMAEAKRQKQIANGQSVTTPSSVNRDDVASSKPAASLSAGVSRPAASQPPAASQAPPAGRVAPLMSLETRPVHPKPADSEPEASTESSVEKPARGPNYCDVCCFEFSSTEVCSMSDLQFTVVRVRTIHRKLDQTDAVVLCYLHLPSQYLVQQQRNMPCLMVLLVANPILQ